MTIGKINKFKSYPIKCTITKKMSFLNTLMSKTTLIMKTNMPYLNMTKISRTTTTLTIITIISRTFKEITTNKIITTIMKLLRITTIISNKIMRMNITKTKFMNNMTNITTNRSIMKQRHTNHLRKSKTITTIIWICSLQLTMLVQTMVAPNNHQITLLFDLLYY